MKIIKSDDLKFKCPKCSGSHFGVNCEDNTITCHGEYLHCNWQGNMKDQWQFFIKVEKTITIYENKEEFERKK